MTSISGTETHKPRTIASNIAFLLFSRIFERLILAVVTIVIARYFGVDTFGQYATAMAYSTLFFSFADFGMSTLFLRESSKDRSNMPVYFGNSLFSETVLAVALYLLMIAIAFAIGYSPTVMWLIVLLGGVQFLLSLQKPLQTVFQILFKTYITSVYQLVNSILIVGGSLLIGLLHLSVIQFSFYQLVLTAVLTAVLLAIALRYARPKLVASELFPMLRIAYLFGLSSIFYFIYFQIDAVMLSIFRGDQDVGLYTAAYKLITAAFIIPSVIGYVVYPLMFELFKTNQERLRNIYLSLYKYFTAAGFPITIIFFLLASRIIDLLYGEDFMRSAGALAILAWSIGLRFLSMAPGQLLTSINQQPLKTRIQGYAAALNIGANLVLIPMFGFMGAAVATVISEAYLVIAFTMKAQAFFGKSPVTYLKKMIPSLAAAAVLVVGLVLIRNQFHVILSVLIASGLYVASLVVSRFFQPEDRKLFQQIVTKTR